MPGSRRSNLATLSGGVHRKHNRPPPPPSFLYGCCSKVGCACALSVLFFLEGKCGVARVSALRGLNAAFNGLFTASCRTDSEVLTQSRVFRVEVVGCRLNSSVDVRLGWGGSLRGARLDQREGHAACGAARSRWKSLGHSLLRYKQSERNPTGTSRGSASPVSPLNAGLV